MKSKINWDDFNKIQNNFKNFSLCNGEIKTLSEKQIYDFNNCIDDCLRYSNIMVGIAECAKNNFEKKS